MTTARCGSRWTEPWSALSPRTRRIVVAVACMDALLRVAALVDLARRPAESVRGSKRRWIAALTLSNSAGAVPVAYFVRGRVRRPGTSPVVERWISRHRPVDKPG